MANVSEGDCNKYFSFLSLEVSINPLAAKLKQHLISLSTETSESHFQAQIKLTFLVSILGNYSLSQYRDNTIEYISFISYIKTTHLSGSICLKFKTRFSCFFMASYLTLKLPDQICNSPYYRPYNSYNVSSGNLVLDQLIIPKLIFFFILITYLVDIV